MSGCAVAKRPRHVSDDDDGVVPATRSGYKQLSRALQRDVERLQRTVRAHERALCVFARVCAGDTVDERVVHDALTYTHALEGATDSSDDDDEHDEAAGMASPPRPAPRHSHTDNPAAPSARRRQRATAAHVVSAVALRALEL